MEEASIWWEDGAAFGRKDGTADDFMKCPAASCLRFQQSVSKLQVTQPICSLKCNVTHRVCTLEFFCVVMCYSTVGHHTVNRRSPPYVSTPAARFRTAFDAESYIIREYGSLLS